MVVAKGDLSREELPECTESPHADGRTGEDESAPDEERGRDTEGEGPSCGRQYGKDGSGRWVLRERFRQESDRFCDCKTRERYLGDKESHIPGAMDSRRRTYHRHLRKRDLDRRGTRHEVGVDHLAV